MVNSPEENLELKKHKMWTCFVCKKDFCKLCESWVDRPYVIHVRLCTEHRPGECTHPLHSKKLVLTKLESCRNKKCKKWVDNFAKRPAACVKQSFRNQIEKLVNYQVYSFFHSNITTIAEREHSYGELVERFPYESMH